ncbi:MAG: rRNA pseudouridine synthase [bacterium]|nr:rRNA pseudouridine synthase [bacterium]
MRPQNGPAKSSRKKRTHPPEAPPGERLQKLIAAAGIASRRAAEQFIIDGRVRVNGVVVKELGARADASSDRITVDGRRLPRRAQVRYLLLYKPRGIVTTTRDPHAKKTVLDLIPGKERLFPVGRLDSASEGLILLTNDGEAAQALLHPSFEVPRTYKVTVDGMVKADSLRKLGSGIEIEGETTAPCEVSIVQRDEARTILEMTLIQGRRRQIRYMMQAVGHPVRRLLRVRFGPLRLRGLKPGDWRPLNPGEQAAIDRMRAQALRARRANRRA